MGGTSYHHHPYSFYVNSTHPGIPFTSSGVTPISNVDTRTSRHFSTPFFTSSISRDYGSLGRPLPFPHEGSTNEDPQVICATIPETREISGLLPPPESTTFSPLPARPQAIMVLPLSFFNVVVGTPNYDCRSRSSGGFRSDGQLQRKQQREWEQRLMTIWAPSA